MANNVSVRLESLRQASSQLTTAKDQVLQSLHGLHSAISELTTTGFKTHMASGRFQQHYQQWNQSTTQVVGALEEIARAVENARAGHEQTDRTLAAAAGALATGGAAAGGSAVAQARSSGGGGGAGGGPPTGGGGGTGGGAGPPSSGGGGSGGGTGSGGGPPRGGSGGSSGGSGGRQPRQVKDPRYESVPSNRVNERLRQIDVSKTTGWGRTHGQGDRYAYDRVKLPGGEMATRTQGMQVTVTKANLPTGKRTTSPPDDLKKYMPGYKKPDGTNNEMQLGHLWADRLGGPNAARNFVPVYPHVNGGAMRFIEGRVKDDIELYGSVRLVALPNYTGNKVVPDSILYAWKPEGATSWTTVLIKNAPRGT